MRRLVVGVALVLAAQHLWCRHAPPALRIATFNIEDFPKDDRQIRGAFAELAQLDAPIIAVEEIMDPARFAREASARLGERWQVAFEPFVDLAYRHNGVLFDREAFRFVSSTTHDETRLGGDHKAVLEVRLQPVDGGTVIRVLVVHLKCCTEGREIRARQHAALATIVRAASRSGERVVVLGDFNATEAADRRDLAALAGAADLHWSTESLACTAFWSRDDGCPRSRLDHVLSWSAGEPHAYGACATEGCAWEPACPVYADHVSDHCPVAVDLR